MRLTIKREELLKGLTTASKAVSSKSASPVLSNVKLDLTESGLFITGSNNETTIKTKVPYANESGEEIIRNYELGATLLPSKIVGEAIRKMGGEEVTIEVVDSTVATISDAKSNYNLNCIRPEEYPEFDLEPNGVNFELTYSQFATMVDQTAFAASTKEQRQILTALNLEAADGILTAIAIDSARMAKKTIVVNSDLQFVANIPAKSLVDVKQLAEGSQNVAISISDKKALFTFKNTVVSTRLIAGEYPNTKNIIPKVTNYALEVSAADVINAINRANVLADERENVVDLTMSEEKVEVTSKSSQTGTSQEKVEPFRYEGQSLKISFNSSFVIQAINAVGSEDVSFLFVGEMKPFVIKNPSDDSIIQVVTPVRTF